MNALVTTYLLYLAISVALTVWVARTLSRHGQLFLVDVFGGDERLANAVNHLLVVGFYLINLGYVTLALKVGNSVTNAQESVEALSVKVGGVLLVLGAMHFFNLYVFSRIRRRHRYDEPDRASQPPVRPDAWTTAGRPFPPGMRPGAPGGPAGPGMRPPMPPPHPAG